MNNTILFAHDFSPSSDNALKLISEFANSTSQSLIIYHVISTSIMLETVNMVDYSAEKEIDSARVKIQAEITEIQKSFPNLKISLMVDFGFLIPTMADKVNDLNPSLLVLGVKKRTGFDKVIFGDVCSTLLDKIKIPMLVIPENTDSFNLNLIACAWDGKSDETEKLHLLKEFGLSDSAKIKVINVNHYDDTVLENSKVFKQNIQNLFGENSIQMIQKLGLGEEETMELALNEMQPDLLVVFAHHYGFWQSLFHKSFSKQAISFSKAPVLVLH